MCVYIYYPQEIIELRMQQAPVTADQILLDDSDPRVVAGCLNNRIHKEPYQIVIPSGIPPAKARGCVVPLLLKKECCTKARARLFKFEALRELLETSGELVGCT